MQADLVDGVNMYEDYLAYVFFQISQSRELAEELRQNGADSIYLLSHIGLA
jgi:2',3'-cyclic-nucleotide 2'-phosphodiesterase (5'-nucleotidase family)